MQYTHTRMHPKTNTYTHTHTHTHTHMCVCKYIRRSLNKFPDFFRVGTFIDSTHMKLKSPSK